MRGGALSVAMRGNRGSRRRIETTETQGQMPLQATVKVRGIGGWLIDWFRNLDGEQFCCVNQRERTGLAGTGSVRNNSGTRRIE